MAKGKQHPSIPHLYRKPAEVSDGAAIFPNLKPAKQEKYAKYVEQPLPKGNLADATRGGLSPLGGAAVKSK
jgi:hypothetical protein